MKKKLLYFIVAILVIAIAVIFYKNFTNKHKTNPQLFWNKILTSTSTEICTTLKTDQEKKDCQYYVLRNTIFNSGDLRNCSKLTTQEDQMSCVATQAKMISNVDSCSVLSNQKQAEYCSSIYYLNKAITNKDSFYCVNIVDQIQKSRCFEVLSHIKK